MPGRDTVRRLNPAQFPWFDQGCGAVVPARHGVSINSGRGRAPEGMGELTRFQAGGVGVAGRTGWGRMMRALPEYYLRGGGGNGRTLEME